MSCGRSKTRRQFHAQRRVAAHSRRASHIAMRTPPSRVTKLARRNAHKALRLSAKRHVNPHAATKHQRPKTTTHHPGHTARKRSSTRARSKAMTKAEAHRRAVLRARDRARAKAIAQRRAQAAARRFILSEKHQCRLLLRKAARLKAKAAAMAAVQQKKAQKAAKSANAQRIIQAFYARERSFGP